MAVIKLKGYMFFLKSGSCGAGGVERGAPEATPAAWAGLTAVLERTLAAQGNSHSGAVE